MAIVVALVFALIVAIMLVVLVVGILSAIAWVLWTAILALAFAVLGALVISAVLTGSADLSSTTALVSGAAIIVLTLAAGNAIRRRRRTRAPENKYARPISAKAQTVRVHAMASPSDPKATSQDPGNGRDPVLAAAWDRLADTADFARSRIGYVRSSCSQFLATADRHPDNADAADFAILIRKRVPERIEQCLADCRVATALETRAELEEAVTELERLGAIAEKRRGALIEASGAPGKRRSLLARRLDNDPFA